ncbi:AraC family transcriptional regulator [Amphiplicatus metriothermophilus]|uniref:Transcriptional regulator, AraC family n=1 Tax=Amphiplicatus metriothermophilus TaxID=1519374 RepID=A0A239PKG3_9PROT|nr:AraC family transcriptional regulator [Amphiplicatus metriothermophilus]MBB5517352.1 AraC-like DNA-binding protein [Amphiplicatus metriothermophilus]SNT68312.1 transcriptional regulator, AraC family [Amphiplicatus metriothermophilus]
MRRGPDSDDLLSSGPGGPASPVRLFVRRSDAAQLQAFAQGVGLARAPTGSKIDPPTTPAEGELMPLAEHFRLLRRLADASDDETFHLSRRPLAPGTTDFVVDVLADAADLEDAMKRAARAYNALHGGYYNKVERRRDRLAYVIDDRRFPYAPGTDPGLACAVMEGVLIFLHAMLSLAAGDALTDRLVCVRTRRTNRTAPDGLLAFWTAPVRCGAPVYALEYAREAAGMPARRRRTGPINAAAVYDLIDEMIAWRERSVPRQDLRARVVETLAAGVDEQSAAARRLGVSVATLRRRLAESGTTFRRLRSEVLAQKAARMLDQGRAVSDVAEALGFADARSFSRAFKAWRGVTPAAYAARGGGHAGRS